MGCCFQFSWNGENRRLNGQLLATHHLGSAPASGWQLKEAKLKPGANRACTDGTQMIVYYCC